ncbi:hypothetical protein BV372_01060 [Nostoc sp. T09]|uniref:AAA-like domain-containing protein n=1 Tax=Nostoc sp. T09 TaxID=1932621 RepID=UPI000A3C00F7|nr:AAA-like domain-containing protein [Nostoc sp. T09]OUL37584.1 hypothetical protein BV372_01060 [Nostoc sp. T09]
MSNQNQTRKILLLSANPKGSSQLRLGEEMREIKEGLKRSKNRDQYFIATLDKYWQEVFGLNKNCTRYFQKYLLAVTDSPLVLAIDNFERLFAYPGMQI